MSLYSIKKNIEQHTKLNLWGLSEPIFGSLYNRDQRELAKKQIRLLVVQRTKRQNLLNMLTSLVGILLANFPVDFHL